MPNFPQVPLDRIERPFRDKIEGMAALGGDTRFFQFAAHAPHIVELYWGQFYRDVFFRGLLPVRLKEMARLRLAALNGCSFCQVGDRASALAHGVSAEEVDALFGDGQCPSFSSAEQAAVDAASVMANTGPAEPMDDALLERLQACFAADQLMELLTVIGILTGMARMLVAAGFIPLTCPVPAAANAG